jgi:WD40 repeat protein/serine/threonine protein kinase
MRFSLLGSLQASGEDGPVPLGGPKQRIVLAHLVLGANRVVSAEHLIDALWGEELPEDPKSTLQVYVSRLRSALGPGAVEAQAPGYVLRADRDEIDALRFEDLLGAARGNGSDPRVTDETLAEALELWRGPALADLSGEPSLTGEITRLEELRLQALEEKIEARLELRRHVQVIAELEGLTQTHPLRERLWRGLMVALYRSDRQAEALAAFERARTVLAEELGIDPSRDLQLLHERILRQDPELDLKGEPLRGYRLLEQIGEGAFGVVYRATQPQIGREVAIKAVAPELANHPDFVRRFEREAQIVAKLEHPHIVPLYDYWREPDAAYLVMRFLRGGSVEDLLRSGPLEPERASFILDQVAAALSAAHRQGIVHRDVKPGNVLLDEVGNAYLTDFGVALEVGSPERSSGTMIRGTPGYLSPEQVRLDPASPRSDIYALGIVAYEMLTGAQPFPESSLTALLDHHLRDAIPSVREVRPDLPAALDRAIGRATAKDPKDRFSDALELAAAVHAALQGGVSSMTVPAGEIRNPYKGLRAFLEADAADFFGRETVTKRLLRRLEEDHPSSRFLAVVGPSGSGKSSVVRAGLVPALRRGSLPGSERWYVIDMLPGAHPLRELESALLGLAVAPPPSLLDELEGDTRGLLRAVDRILPDPDAELLIVLDQLEEVFTLIEDEDERFHILESLRAATTEAGSRVRIVATLRADFFDQPLSVRGFGDLLAQRTEAIMPMSPEELERAIVAPAERTGLVVEPRLLAAMIADVVDRPGALPLLQFTLTELAERREDGVLTLVGYRRIGGVSGALARRAEQLFEGMNEGARDACRQVFLRLATLGEGSEVTRRRVRRSELQPLTDARTLDGVLDAFGRHRLLSYDRDPETREPTVEIAHEALLGAWDRLSGWIDEARDDIRTQRRLAAAVAEWESAERDPSYLLRGARLDQVHEWADTTTLALSDADRAYVAEGVEVQRAVSERERGMERRSVRRLRSLVALGVAAALVATTLTVVAVNQRGRAEDAARVSLARELAAAAVANLDVDPERSILLALAAVDATWEVDRTVEREAEEALHRALQESRVVLTVPQGRAIALSADGGRFATTGEDGTAIVWETDTGKRLLTLRGHKGEVNGIAFSPDGSLLATAGDDRTVRLWDAASGRQIHVLRGHRDLVLGAAFSPDGSLLATSSQDGTVRIWGVAAGTQHFVLRGPPGEGFYNASGLTPAFSPDGSRVASGGWKSTPIWDLATGKISMVLPRQTWWAAAVAFSPDGTRIATDNHFDSQAWDAATGKPLTAFSGHTGDVLSIAYSPDSTRIATGADDGTAQVWDAATGESLLTLAGHSVGVQQVAFTPDGDRLLTGGMDGTARLWDITPTGGRDWLTVPGPANRQGGVSFSPDGTSFAVPGQDSGVTIRDVETGAKIITLEGHDATIRRMAFSPDGTRLAGASGSGQGNTWVKTVPIWDVTTGELVMTLTGHSKSTTAVAYSPDGRRLATGSDDGTVRLWDASSGKELRAVEVGSSAYALAFSPDGRWLVSNNDRHQSLTVWDADSLERIGELRGHTDFVQDVAFAPDGKVVTGSFDGTAKIWDLESDRELATLRGHTGAVMGVAVSPDGTLVATGSLDGTAKLWDLATGRNVLTLFGHDGPVNTVTFSPDGRFLATVSADGTVALHLLRIDELRDLARERVTRTLTDEECRQYLHVEGCPVKI